MLWSANRASLRLNHEPRMVGLRFASWNPIAVWLRHIGEHKVAYMQRLSQLSWSFRRVDTFPIQT